LELAEAAVATGEYAEADQVFRQVLATAEQGSDRLLEGRVCARLGVLLRRRERPEEAAAWLSKALALLEQHGEIGETADVLMELAGLEGVTLANYERAEAFGERALALAEAADDARLRAAAALALASVRIRSRDPAAGRPLLLQALDLALQADDAVLAAEACAVLANSHYWSAEMRKSEDYARRRLVLAERAGDLFGMRHAHSWLAIVLIAFGRWPEARELLDRSALVLSRLDSPEPVAFVRYLQALIDFQHGRYEDAYVQLTEAISQFHPATLLWYRGVQAQAALELGRTVEALRLVDLVEAELRELPASALPARSARTVLGLIYAQLGDRERGAECERALRPFADDFHWLLARRSLASLAALRGDPEQALRDLALAETRARQESLQPDLAFVLLHRAELLGASRPEGRAAISEARTLLTSLDMRRALARADALVPPTASPAGLTARELEVLRLIAQGRTNREIAEELVVSERTVINHVSHILNKMGVDNRTTAAAWALRQGIA
jgi:DNA-binding CsgD family transcriptional regulator